VQVLGRLHEVLEGVQSQCCPFRLINCIEIGAKQPLSSLRSGAMAPEPLEAEFKEVSEPPESERTSKKPAKSVRLIKGGE